MEGKDAMGRQGEDLPGIVENLRRLSLRCA